MSEVRDRDGGTESSYKGLRRASEGDGECRVVQRLTRQYGLAYRDPLSFDFVPRIPTSDLEYE